jgi:hypothetical protein
MEGVVTDNANPPNNLEGVTVWVIAQGPEPITPGDGGFLQVQTDQNGHYATPYIFAPQAYAVSAIKSGYWTSTQYFLLNEAGDYGPYQANFQLDIATPLIVTGTVTAAGVGGLLGAVVTLDGGLRTKVIDNQGKYKLTYNYGNPAGSHTVTAAFPGFMSESRTFSVSTGTTVPENFVLLKLGSLSGTVIDTAGNKIGGATVAAGMVSSTSDKTTGAYSLPGLDPVLINGTARAPDFDVLQFQVTIPAGENKVYDPQLTKGSATLTGTVTALLDGTQVIASVAVSGFNTTNTDGTGRYTLTGVPAGTHLVTASAVRFFRPQTATVSVVANETLEQDFLLEPTRPPPPV